MFGGGSRVPITLSATSGPSASRVTQFNRFADIGSTGWRTLQRATCSAIGTLGLLRGTLLFERLGRLALLLSLLVHAFAHRSSPHEHRDCAEGLYIPCRASARVSSYQFSVDWRTLLLRTHRWRTACRIHVGRRPFMQHCAS